MRNPELAASALIPLLASLMGVCIIGLVLFSINKKKITKFFKNLFNTISEGLGYLKNGIDHKDEPPD